VALMAHDMLQAMAGEGPEGMAGAAMESLVRAFQNELLGEPAESFLLELESLIRASIEAGKNVSAWHDALSVLREQTAPALTDPDAVARAENLWHQARVLIGKSAAREEVSQRLHAEQLASRLREIEQVLITTFDVSDIMDVLACQLPLIGIPRCYLAMFEGPQTYQYPAPAPEWARLRLAYDERGRIALPPDGWRFPSWQFTPPEILPPQAPIHLVARALYFKQDQIGFVLFEPGPRDGYIYDALRGQISSALQGALLMQGVRERSAEIARQKYILDTFMASVPDSIYFKDRDSRFTQANQALAQLFGIDDPAELIGKSDFDFFAADQAQPKYDQEQAIMRTRQALLNLEEPDAGGRWALTTKMPLRDEHGEIIGTFGISRDITPLKQAQLEVAAAYEEIKVLNKRLQEENLRMSAELEVSRRIQQMVLPAPAELVQIEGLDVVGYMQPAEEVGGDYYDVLQKDDVLHIGIGDVTGHGLESGVLMLMTQTAIRTLIEHGETDPKSFLTTLNRVILKNTQRMHVDKTLTFALVKYEGGEVKIVGQHEELLMVRQGGRIERVDTLRLGFLLGLEENVAAFLAEATVTLQSGESLVLYTDGITEAENVDQQMYGLERLCEVLSREWDKPAEQIKQAVVEDVLRFIGPQRVYDDITLVVLKQ
jgi:PAS domain S-box-containing protein